ncbi:RIP metalloprotease RseP [Alcaligenaceae bacterium CGII-47]|nr:RIP metalloprotease RseP [Alcaligenaceae bacterium CGII-47]
MLLTLLAFAFALGVLVTFHEYGHYWVARRCGVTVLRFSVGFGKVLWQRVDRHGTQWAFSAIPLGGYVKMLDEPPQGATESVRQSAFKQKSLAQRTAIVVAGPFANLLLAALLYTVLGMMGSLEPAAVLSAAPPDTPAARAGILAGDEILAVNHSPVRSWTEARWALLDPLSQDGKVELRVRDATGTERERTLDAQAVQILPEGPDPLAQVGLALVAPQPRLGDLVAGGAAAQADLRPGDTILAIGTIEHPTVREMIDYISGHPDQTIALRILRDGVTVTTSVVPRSEAQADGSTVGRIGVMVQAERPVVQIRDGLFVSAWQGLQRTGEVSWFSLKMMGRMVFGNVSLKNISGPVTIADYAGQTARLGLQAYLSFLALISISIGILNLLPIPMLDGGHLLYYLIEAVRGRPVSARAQEVGQRTGLSLLLVLMGLAFFNDFMRLFS